jgi:hypothetical protein
MTKPSITYDWVYGDDFCDGETDWTRTLGGMTAGQTYTNPQVNDGDVFELEGVCDDAGDEYVFYQKDITNFSSDIYDTAVVRWKTSHSAAGLGAKVRLNFTAGTQSLLHATDPQFSIGWKTTVTTITPAKTVDSIDLFAADYPDAVDAGTFQVYYDFILLCKRFTFPFISETEEIELLNNINYLKLPSRVGNITQNMGADSPIIRFSGKMDDNANWEDSTGLLAGDLFTIWLYQNTENETFQWLSTDLLGATGGCKVTIPRLVLRKVAGSKSKRMFSMDFRHYSLSSGDAASWSWLNWLGAKET